jgi:hypothetical protein
MKGYAATDSLLYCKTYDVFVGPGAGTPTYDLSVPSAQLESTMVGQSDCKQ